MSDDAPNALVVRAAGTNCDAEMVRAFELAGAAPDLVHLDTLAREPERLDAAPIIGFPGGFSYGDDIASGRVQAMLARERLYPALKRAADRGALIIGVCNGFQVLTQIGLLPGPLGDDAGAWPGAPPPRTAALLHNDSGRFTDRWVRVDPDPGSVCVWTRGLPAADLRLPIANGEGRFWAPDHVLDALEQAGQVALRYAEPVNGSVRHIAGICDASGRILGLMPHPERFAEWRQHPWWTRLSDGERAGDPPGLTLFRNAVQAAGNPAGAAT